MDLNAQDSESPIIIDLQNSPKILEKNKTWVVIIPTFFLYQKKYVFFFQEYLFKKTFVLEKKWTFFFKLKLVDDESDANDTNNNEENNSFSKSSIKKGENNFELQLLELDAEIKQQQVKVKTLVTTIYLFSCDSRHLYLGASKKTP